MQLLKPIYIKQPSCKKVCSLQEAMMKKDAKPKLYPRDGCGYRSIANIISSNSGEFMNISLGFGTEADGY